jgi:hypothetical protein
LLWLLLFGNKKAGIKPHLGAAAMMLFLLWLMSGIEGMPAFENAEDVIDALGQGLGKATNSRRFIREMLSDLTFSFLDDIISDEGKAVDIADSLTEAFVRGPVSAYTGGDVSGRFSLGRFFPGTKMLVPSNWGDANMGDMLSSSGLPFFGLLGQIGQALYALWQGKVKKAATLASPRSAQNAMQGAGMIATGEYRDKDGKLIQEVSTAEGIAKMIGLHPESVGKESRVRAYLAQDMKIRKTVVSRIIDTWSQGILEKDRAKGDVLIKDAIEMNQKWNKDNPEMPIKLKRGAYGGIPLAVKKKVNDARRTANERMMKRAPKQMRRYIDETLSE